jgi:hypothetical protein
VIKCVACLSAREVFPATELEEDFAEGGHVSGTSLRHEVWESFENRAGSRK